MPAALAHYEQVVENVKAFYFRDRDRSGLGEDKEYLVVLNQWIKESKYNSEVKSALYAFFIDPVPMIQKLIYELMSKELIMAQQYEQNLPKRMELKETFDYLQLAEGLK